jgi:hypothetical protein
MVLAAEDGPKAADAGAPDEASIRRDISDAVTMAGLMALERWKERREADAALSEADLVADVYVAMRRAAARYRGAP